MTDSLVINPYFQIIKRESEKCRGGLKRKARINSSIGENFCASMQVKKLKFISKYLPLLSKM